jgi:hypothetical protein
MVNAEDPEKDDEEKDLWKLSRQLMNFYIKTIFLESSCMSFSISRSTGFSEINWSSFENRPQINSSMQFCREKDWYEDAKCCMDGYSIEHILDAAYEHGNENTPEVKFLDQYPCLNGVELDHFANAIDRMPSKVDKTPTSEFPTFECISETIFEGLKKVLPQTILEFIEPYLCKS